MTAAPRSPLMGPPTGWRKPISLAAKVAALEAALLAAWGAPAGSRIQYDHAPAIHLREWDPRAKDTIPRANDPRHLVPMLAEAHREKTSGRATRARAEGDVTEIARMKRLADEQAEFRSRLLAKKPGQPRERKTRIPSRGFPKRDKRTKT
jgi:hypothetical protein